MSSRGILTVANLNLGTLRESLLAHGIRPLIPLDLAAGTDWASEIQRQLQEADLVIGVLPSSRQAPFVMFELGQACALGKRILLISSSKADWLSFALKRVLVLRVDVKNRQALDFALEQFLSAPTHQQPEQIRKQFESKALGPQADVLLERLKQWRKTEDEQTLEGIVGDALRDTGTDMRQVQAENRKLKRKLEKFEAMLDLQKKVSQLLGISLASSEENGDES